MMRTKGSILIIVVIIVGALYLLAGMLFIVNQQYFSDMVLMRSAANNRQKLLSVARANIRQVSGATWEDGQLEEWQFCDAEYFPDGDEDGDMLMSKVQLGQHCYDGYWAYRIGLSSLENMGSRLVMDHLIWKDDWEDRINHEQYSVDITSFDNVWRLVLNNGALHKEIVLIESDELPKLVDQAMRIHHAHCEIVLVFEDDVNQQVMLYHLWIPIATLHFHVDMIFQFHLSEYSTYDYSDIVAMNINDTNNPNWQMVIDQKLFDAMLIKNNVIFATLDSYDQSHTSIIGVYLTGSPFFSERLMGFEYKVNDKVIELIPCLYRLPLIVAGQWQIGCDVQQKTRYYFPE